MKNMIEIKNNELYIATDVIATELGREHRTVTNLVNTYKQQLQTFGVLRFENVPSFGKDKGGGTKKIFYLNEKQYIFLITNMRTKADEIDTVMKVKLEIASQFVDMKRALLDIETNKRNQEWIEKREQGKITRKETTKVYKEYLEYAIAQKPDSNYAKRPDTVYINFTKMINKALFDLVIKIPKGNSTRDYMSTNQLIITNTAELVAQKIIHDEIDKGTHYKDIYKIVKNKMDTYAEIVCKSTINELITKENQKQIGGN